ncbi:30S ribosomal protein S9 [Bacillus sp. ISL-75]|nr:30S ribosomal protein S9 [Bacillus sp. ISL-75]
MFFFLFFIHIKERKKYGLKGARRAHQFSKR